MPRSPERLQMDLLQMTRREVAAVPFLGRNDLPEKRLYEAAQMLDEAIHAQFPHSEEGDRLGIATGLARQLRDPHPSIVVSCLRRFYEYRRRMKASAGTDDGAAEESQATRKPDLER